MCDTGAPRPRRSPRNARGVPIVQRLGAVLATVCGVQHSLDSTEQRDHRAMYVFYDMYMYGADFHAACVGEAALEALAQCLNARWNQCYASMDSSGKTSPLL